ncbi:MULTISPECIES: hypothetical protein [Rhizobium]|nr:MULTISPECIES: hypothetical protein [Rhizobium]MBB4507069.1 hypothetical protein [Rhizobium leguminosarum]
MTFILLSKKHPIFDRYKNISPRAGQGRSLVIQAKARPKLEAWPD